MIEFSSIGIVGQGYVGKSLAEVCLKSKYKVVAVDIDPKVISEMSNRFIADSYTISSDYSSLSSCSVVVIAVPTNLNNGTPDYSNILNALKSASQFISKKTLVVIESTVGVGFTKDIARKIIIDGAGHSDFYLSHVPERINPGSNYPYENITRVVSGMTSVDRFISNSFYKTIVNDTVLADTLEEAEASKLLENSFRLVNIAFINQFNAACKADGINAKNVINLSSSKPYGYMPFYPSSGAGGDCIPVDPVYLLESLHSIPILEEAVDYNSKSADRIIDLVKDKFGNLDGKVVAVIGTAYKPNVASQNNSVGISLIEKLKLDGVAAYSVDHLVDGKSGILDRTDFGIIVNRHTTQPEYAKIPIIDVSEGI